MGFGVTRQQFIASLGTIGMVLLAIGSAKVLDRWIGDLGALLWFAAAFFIPYLVGIALGQRGASTQGRLIGALIGVLIVVGPTLSYALISKQTLTELELPLLWSLFIPLALAAGAISTPVGATVRRVV